MRGAAVKVVLCAYLKSRLLSGGDAATGAICAEQGAQAVNVHITSSVTPNGTSPQFALLSIWPQPGSKYRIVFAVFVIGFLRKILHKSDSTLTCGCFNGVQTDIRRFNYSALEPGDARVEC